MHILGLDISTSVIGYTIIDERCSIKEMSHIEFKKNLNFWRKVDFAIEKLKLLIEKHDNDLEIFVEEPVLGFSSGKSSANTIMTLAKFNYIVSYCVRNMIKKDPNHVTVAEARKRCGLKMQQRKKCGKSHKEQTFEYMIINDLKDIDFEKTKNQKYKNFVYDEVDSYVIAKAGLSILESRDCTIKNKL